MLLKTLLPLAVLTLSACTHLKGVVLDERTNRPLTTAILSVGRPDGVAVYERHAVNERGEFDFHLLPTDNHSLYVYDSAGDAQSTLRRIDQSEFSKNMKIRMRSASPDMMPGMNQRPF